MKRKRIERAGREHSGFFSFFSSLSLPHAPRPSSTMRAALGTTTARTTTSRSVTFCHGGIAAPARAPPSPLFAGRLASAAAAAPLASRFACSAAPAPPSASPPAAEGGVEPPSSAVTARTIVDLVAHGTLCTVGEDGAPLGKRERERELGEACLRAPPVCRHHRLCACASH